jgi:hypothetical protein
VARHRLRDSSWVRQHGHPHRRQASRWQRRHGGRGACVCLPLCTCQGRGRLHACSWPCQRCRGRRCQGPR